MTTTKPKFSQMRTQTAVVRVVGTLAGQKYSEYHSVEARCADHAKEEVKHLVATRYPQLKNVKVEFAHWYNPLRGHTDVPPPLTGLVA